MQSYDSTIPHQEGKGRRGFGPPLFPSGPIPFRAALMGWLILTAAIGFLVYENQREVRSLREYYEDQLDSRVGQVLMRYEGDRGGLGFNASRGITGVYLGDYFCVWVKGRRYEEVMETCNHEWLHSTRGKEHFCGGGG